MKFGISADARAPNIAGVVWDFWLNESDFKISVRILSQNFFSLVVKETQEFSAQRGKRKPATFVDYKL